MRPPPCADPHLSCDEVCEPTATRWRPRRVYDAGAAGGFHGSSHEPRRRQRAAAAPAGTSEPLGWISYLDPTKIGRRMSSNRGWCRWEKQGDFLKPNRRRRLLSCGEGSGERPYQASKYMGLDAHCGQGEDHLFCDKHIYDRVFGVYDCGLDFCATTLQTTSADNLLLAGRRGPRS